MLLDLKFLLRVFKEYGLAYHFLDKTYFLQGREKSFSSLLK